MSTWRVGRKLGRTLYKDEVCVGMVDSPELAKAICDTMNGGQEAPCDCSEYNEPGTSEDDLWHVCTCPKRIYERRD